MMQWWNTNFLAGKETPMLLRMSTNLPADSGQLRRLICLLVNLSVVDAIGGPVMGRSFLGM